MDVSQLYSLYRAGHAEARGCSGRSVLRALEVVAGGAVLTSAERLIIELAVHDATNGTPTRSRESFDLAVTQAAALFVSRVSFGGTVPGAAVR